MQAACHAGPPASISATKAARAVHPHPGEEEAHIGDVLDLAPAFQLRDQPPRLVCSAGGPHGVRQAADDKHRTVAEVDGALQILDRRLVVADLAPR